MEVVFESFKSVHPIELRVRQRNKLRAATHIPIFKSREHLCYQLRVNTGHGPKEGRFSAK